MPDPSRKRPPTNPAPEPTDCPLEGQPGRGRGSAAAAELTAEGGSARSVVEVVAEELGPSLRWATATPVRTTRSTSE
jgi:hypothetical protein